MKALLVEDDSSIRNVLRMSLESENFIVDEAEDGEQGSYIGRVNEYDIIILDNMLPKKRGKQVCQEIREAGKHTPIIILSARNEVLEKVDLLQSGADDYITKPFSFEEFMARIATVTRRPKQIASTIYKVGDLFLNSDTHEVTRRDSKIYLTRKEFALLEYLMKQEGKVVSRGTLMEHVWDMNVDPFSNTLEAHIMNLRKKIGSNKRNKLIHTIPGRGYKIGLQNI